MPISKPRRKTVLIGGLLALTLAGGGAAVMASQPKPYTPTAEESAMMEKARAYNASVEKAQAERNAPAMLNPLPVGAKVLIFGDSWTRGRGAENPETEGYAPILAKLSGWDAQVEGEGGTGYLNPGSGDQVPYTERVKTIKPRFSPDLIILQGSQNDTSQDINKLPEAILATIDTFKARFPKAQLLMIGPGPSNAAAVNTALTNAADVKKIPYIDSIAAGWMTGQNATEYMLPDYHPSTEGHTWLAKNIKIAIANITKG